MKTAAVVIDDWKLIIFKKHLDKAGFTYTEHNGPTPGCITLSVKTETAEKLQPVVQDAYNDAARSKHN